MARVGDYFIIDADEPGGYVLVRPSPWQTDRDESPGDRVGVGLQAAGGPQLVQHAVNIPPGMPAWGVVVREELAVVGPLLQRPNLDAERACRLASAD